MSVLKFVFLGYFVVALLSIISLRDDVYCRISSEDEALNGYYSAVGGMYVRKGRYFDFTPEFFGLYNAHRSTQYPLYVISQNRHGWEISQLPGKEVIYNNSPTNPSKYLYNPPPNDWKRVGSSEVASLRVTDCVGSLADSPAIVTSHSSNLEIMKHRPITTLLCAVIIYIAYHLWANRVDVTSVSYIYDRVVNGELWRFFSASFAHFDLLHLGFNTMSLYQLGELESVYGSVTFAYLNIALVILTMAICTAMYHFLIVRYNQVNLIHQPAVGYSCVLFAWMVASSVRMTQYCPLFFYPSLCFPTYFIPLFSYSFPVNFGPFVLLIITKFIIPRSSLTGHLAGILIGYPLAWMMLNWITPAVLTGLCVLLYCCFNRILPWKFPGFHTPLALENELSEDEASNYLNLKRAMAFALACAIAFPVQFGWSSVVTRAMLVVMIYVVYHARKCIWMTDLDTSRRDYIMTMLCTALLCLVMSYTDLATLCGLFSSTTFLRSYNVMRADVLIGGTVAGLSLISEILLAMAIILSLQDVRFSREILAGYGLDTASCIAFLKSLGCGSPSVPTYTTPRYASSAVETADVERAPLLIDSDHGEQKSPQASNRKKKTAKSDMSQRTTVNL